MDLKLYFSVLWRFKFLVAFGILFAMALAVLAAAAPNFSGKGPILQYRQGEQWVSYSELFVTQKGFLWGEVTPGAAKLKDGEEAPPSDPNRFSNLAVVYAHLATSDRVRAIILKDGPMHGEIDAAPVQAGDSNLSGTLPLIRIAAIADSEQHALDLVVRSANAFKRFLAEMQETNKIPEGNRVRVTTIKHADKPQIFAGRSMTLPIVVFMAVMILISGLCFILENMRPRTRPRPVAAPAEDSSAGDPARLSA